MPGSTYSIHLNEELSKRFEEYRVKANLTRSDVMRSALVDYLDKMIEAAKPSIVYPTADTESLP